MGDISFFEGSIAELLQVPLINVQQLIHDPGGLGLNAAYQKAGLPAEQFPAVQVAIDVVREMEYDGDENDRERYSRACSVGSCCILFSRYSRSSDSNSTPRSPYCVSTRSIMRRE